MDEAAEFFLKAIFWMMVAPLWIAWKLLALIWEFILEPLMERYREKSADKHLLAFKEQQKPRDEARAKQLEALRAAVPAGPPERMRATIQVNEYKQARLERQRISRLIGEDTYVSVEVGEDFCFSVDMILEMSETERAIIKQHNLHDIELEETPAFTAEALSDIEARYADEVEAIKNLTRKAVTKQITQESLARLKNKRVKTCVGDLLVSPFSRSFESPHEAKKYADKLKTEFLPEIRKLLDGYTAHKQSETLEF
jgi:hypothetical protein